jgi:propanol-preferring alcohol dehydrogenase
MRTYSVTQFGAPIVAVELPEPTATGKQVVVEVEACGLCHSDIHYHEGHIGLGGDAKLNLPDIGVNVPLTLGHEIYGHISSAGPESGLTASDIGKPVIVFPWMGCGHCEACLAGRDNECATPQHIGREQPGGFGEKVVVREPRFLIDAQGITPTIAGIYACSGLTAYSALRKIPSKDRWIGIIGMGGVGLMALAIAKGIGFSKVAVLDIDNEKLALAKEQYDADLTINSSSSGASAQLLDQTGGLAAVVDVVGSDATAALGIGLLNIGGTYIDVGLFGGAVHLPLAILASRQLTVRGSLVGNPTELHELMAHVRANQIKPIPVTTRPIAAVNDGIAALHSGTVKGRLVYMHEKATFVG